MRTPHRRSARRLHRLRQHRPASTPDAAAGSGSGSGSGSGITPDAAIINSTTPVIPTPTGLVPDDRAGRRHVRARRHPTAQGQARVRRREGRHRPADLLLVRDRQRHVRIGATRSATTEATITDAGGIVATPYADATAGQFEWFIVNQSPKQDDFLVADEVVGCLAQAHMIDTNRIHSMGMSAGALQTTAISFIRASYIASVATYSGGVPPGFTPTNQDPENKFAAFIFDGGTSDDVFSVDFQAASESYKAMLVADGHFAAICDHNMGHAIPLDAAPSVAAFFAANPWGAWPSPYASGLPAVDFPRTARSNYAPNSLRIRGIGSAVGARFIRPMRSVIFSPLPHGHHNPNNAAAVRSSPPSTRWVERSPVDAASARNGSGAVSIDFAVQPRGNA